MNKLKNLLSITLLLTLLLSISTPVFADSSKTSEDKTPSGILLSELETEVDQFMSEHIGISAPGASVAIVKNGEIVLSKGYGYADLENSIPVTPSTVFEYGSISKLFVWTSVMQLVEDGKLDLDENIEFYLPASFTEKWNPQYPITMRHIMNHSSGFGEYPFDLIESSFDNENFSLEEAILSAHPAQYYEPGTASVYSNYATAIAGYTVESISGEKFYEYEKNHIFDILSMKDSAGEIAWKDNESIIDHKSLGYSLDGNGSFSNTGWSYVSLYPAGSVNGTADDLARFAIALMPEGQEKSPLFDSVDTLSSMLSPSYTYPELGTAHGFFEYPSANAQAFGHGGNTASFSTQFAFVPEESFAIVILTNSSSELDITSGLQALLLGKPSIKGNGTTSTNFPSSSIVTGNYISMRGAVGTPMEFASYLSPTTIVSIEENKISFNLFGYSGIYEQTAPYTYELIEGTHPLFQTMFPTLIFKLDQEGNPSQIIIGKGMDYSSYPNNHTPVSLTLNIISLVIGSLFFTVIPVVLLISFIRKRKKDSFNKNGLFFPRLGLTLSGPGFLINNGLLFINLISNQFIEYSGIIPFQIINYILSAIALGFFIWGIVRWKKETKTSEKIWFAITIILLVTLICLFITWNLFTILF